MISAGSGKAGRASRLWKTALIPRQPADHPVALFTGFTGWEGVGGEGNLRPIRGRADKHGEESRGIP